jgi:CHRD domain/Bacterial Ig domain
MSNTRRIEPALAVAPLWGAALLLAACGGGGGGMGSTPTAVASNAMGSGSMGMSCMGSSMDTGSMDMNGMSCPAPTVALASPPGIVSRTVTLSARVGVTEGDAVMRVDFLVDGARVGTATAAPFSVSWDSTTVGDGPHALTAMATDSFAQSVGAGPVTLQVDNHPTFAITLSAAQIVPAPASAASGSAHLSVDLGKGAVGGSVVLSGITATAVTLNQAFAGESGAQLIALEPGASSAQWNLPAGALLTAEEVTALLQGGLYVSVSSPANPAGELRGQITPANVMVTFSTLSGSQEVPAVAINATGVAAITVDTVANTLTVHLHASGVADAMAAELAEGAAGAIGKPLAALARDPADAGHWSAPLVTVGASDVDSFKASGWYLNVMTPADPDGAIRGQIEPGGP